MKKSALIIEYAADMVVLTFLHYTEYKLGVRAFALAYYFAAVYNRRNVIILSPVFIASALIAEPTLASLIIAITPVVLVLILLFILYRARVQMRLMPMAVAAIPAMLPRIFLETGSLEEIIATVVGAVGTEIMFFVFVAILYLVLIKRFEFRLTGGESVAIAIALATVGLGMGYASIGSLSFYYPVAIYIIIISAQTGASAPLFAGAALAIGASISGGLDVAVYTAVYAIGVGLCPREYAYFGGVIGLAISALMMVTGVTEKAYLGLVMPAVGVVLGIVTPSKFKQYIHSVSITDSAYTGARTIVNRNRKEVASKLIELRDSLRETGDILSDDAAASVMPDCNEIAKEVSKRCCNGCPNEGQCRSSLRGSSTEEVIGELVSSALNAGRASILDASPYLSARCKRLQAIIASTNDIIGGKEAGGAACADEYRELLRDQLISLSEILSGLALDVGEPVRYDGQEEKKIKEALGRRLVGVREVYAYDGGRISLTVRESENVIKKVGETVNSLAGRRMSLTNSEPTVNGLINLTYEPAPEYRVAYGERVLASNEGGCGDRECVSKLTSDRVMIVLADGMGHDLPASRNARYAVKLIESFYRAGFDHNTVLKSVGRLLSLRRREEFNAVDIAVIDTTTGVADIIKQGARESFVVRKGEVEVLECGSLPLGIVDGVAPVTHSVRLTPDCFLVLISDGVIDVIGREGMIDLLSSIQSVNPDDVAEAVISDFSRLAGEDGERDDASVIVARIF